MFSTPALALAAFVLVAASPAARMTKASAILVIAPHDDFPDIRRVPDRELAVMRGGVLLPDGLNIDVGIDIQTRLNGALILHTVYSTDGPAAGIKVYTDGTTAPSTTPATVSLNTAAAASTPTIIVDRATTGTIVAAPSPTQPITVNLLQGAPSTWLDGQGQNVVPVIANGPAVSSDGNEIQLATGAQGAIVTLNGPGLEVQQLVGQATGVVVANTGNDRVITTVSSINVDVQGISPALMAGIFAADRLATAAIQARGL